ncbi:MAG: hypothetical protein J6V23_02935 [Bacteroidaceae bacterium]|nr:hypothetical protein [Bacteroidaceae bacterium]
MKKEYLEPSAHLVEVEIDAVMNVVSGETGSAGTGEGELGDGDGEEAVKRPRGEWGNLWL